MSENGASRPDTAPVEQSGGSRIFRWGALILGVVIFFATLYYVNVAEAAGTVRRLGVALPLAVLFSGLWHLARTWAWAWCFPQPRSVGFARLARVRLSAEAFSYLTLRGIAGEPLKVVLLAGSVDVRESTAAVALERLAYLVGTTLLVGVASAVAIVELPLSRTWFRVFRAFTIASALIGVLSAIVIGGRGTYLRSLLGWIDETAGTRLAEGTAGKFATAVERHMLELVRGNPRRLVVLSVATAAAFVCMVLEAWVILRAIGAPITLGGAFAVETFSRVASFVSAFIPANIGALEASSVAAASAVGASAGGAALALARRIRGLFWAGVGLAIYPRKQRPAAAPARAREQDGVDRKPTLLFIPEADDVSVPPMARLAGLPIAERVVRAAQRAGYRRIVIAAFDRNGSLSPSHDFLRRVGATAAGSVTLASSEQEWRRVTASIPGSDIVTVVGAGTVVSPALLAGARSIAPAVGEIADVPAGPGWRESGVLRVASAFATDLVELQEQLALRRARSLPMPSGEDVSHGRARLALRVRHAPDLQEAEAAIRRSSYKPTDGKVARFNRRMSLPVSIALMRTPLTANQLSVALVAMGFYSAWLFSLGHYWTGVLAGFLSLAASVLDGCDGEIARLKYQESALGCWIETFGDYSYYIAIFVGLTVGSVRATRWDGFYWLGALALGGTLLCFAILIYLRNRITAGQPEKLHAIARTRFKVEQTLWSKIIWRISFVATRAAMPYGIMTFALLELLPGIVVLAALGANLYWISLVLKLRDLLGGREEQSATA